jgi:hypothetical protein
MEIANATIEKRILNGVEGIDSWICRGKLCLEDLMV